MNKDQDGNSSNDNKYLNIPFEDLRFVRVVSGLNDSTIDTNGTLNLALPDETNLNKRNTTHGTLNAVVDDHLMGKFSNAKYAVVAPLMDMARSNEMLSISPSDTYFWNNNNSVKIPNPTVFAPSDAELNDSFLENLNVVRYPSDPSDSLNNYKNMTNAIKEHFDEKNLPFYTVDNRSWNRTNPNDPKMDNGADTKKVADYIGYNISHGLHDGTAYSELENIYLQANKTLTELNGLNTRQDYEQATNQRLNILKEPSYGEVVDHGLSQFKELMGDLPNHQRIYYNQNVLPTLNSLKNTFDSKLELWFGNDEELTVENVGNAPLPPPIPESVRQDSNQMLFDVMRNYNNGFLHSNLKKDEEKLDKIRSAIQVDVMRFAVLNNPELPIMSKDNLYDHYNNLNDNEKKSFGSMFQRLLSDTEASENISQFIDVSTNIVKKSIALIHEVTDTVSQLAPNRNLDTPELLHEWNYQKDLMVERSDADFNKILVLNQTAQMLNVAKNHVETSPQKSWFELLSHKHGYLEELDTKPVLDTTHNLKSEYTGIVKEFKDAINAPTESMLLKKQEQLLAEANENELLNPVIKPEPKTDLQKATDNIFNAKPVIKVENEVEVDNQPLSAKDFLNDYNNGISNKHNKFLLAEKDRLKQAKVKLEESFKNLTDILLKEGLSKHDIMFKSDKTHPEVSYDARIILNKSPQAQKALSVAANSLESYGQLCISHQEHFESNLNKVIKADISEDKTPSEVTTQISNSFKNHELNHEKYTLLVEQFNPKIENKDAVKRIRELNDGLYDSLNTVNLRKRQKEQGNTPDKYEFKYNI